ncbi:hypothetical protein JZ751_011140, partial [Albula glossodonta]
MREIFLDEGVEERVLEDLRRLWESKVMQSKAVEGFMKETLNPSNFVLQLPANYAQSLHKPTVSYPVQIPAGVTLQTSSGHLYKVNVPVMVTQGPGASRILSQPVQNILEPREPPAPQRAVASSILHNVPSQVTDLYPPPVPAWPVLHPPEVQQQQQQALMNQRAPSDPPAAPPPTSQQTPLLPPESPSDQFTLDGIEFSPQSVDMSLPSPFSDFQVKTGLTPAAGSEVRVRGEEEVYKQEAGAMAERAESARPEDPVRMKMRPPCDYNHNLLEDIVQLDGACGGSSSEEEREEEEEVGEGHGIGENEFLGMINAEALRALQEGEDSTAGGSSDSCSDGVDDLAEEEEEEEVRKEGDPLNSGDDVSEQDVPDLFDTDNVVVCQYDKIHRSKNRWKFYLKDGVMCFGGKDYVFSKAVGEAECQAMQAVELGPVTTATTAAQQQVNIQAEGTGEDGVQEGVAERVDWVEEDEQDLGVGHGDEGHTQRGGDGEEGDGCHAQEVCEYEHAHTLGHLGIAAAGGQFRVAYAGVDAAIASTHHQEGSGVEQEHGNHIALGCWLLYVHGQADADLSVAADPQDRQQGSQQREGPTHHHHDRHVAEAQFPVESHGIGDGVPALQGNDSQCVHRQLASKHCQESCHPTTSASLPVGGVVVVLTPGAVVHRGDEEQVAQDSGHGNDPGNCTQEGIPEEIFTGVEGIRFRCAPDGGIAQT